MRIVLVIVCLLSFSSFSFAQISQLKSEKVGHYLNSRCELVHDSILVFKSIPFQFRSTELNGHFEFMMHEFETYYSASCDSDIVEFKRKGYTRGVSKNFFVEQKGIYYTIFGAPTFGILILDTTQFPQVRFQIYSSCAIHY